MYKRQHELRFVCIFLTLIVCLIYFSFHLVLIQIFKSSYLANLAQKQHNHIVELEPIRGTIYDRNLRPMALNIPAYSVYANPRLMSSENKRKAIKELSAALNVSPEFISEKLSRPKYFVWIQRKISIDMARKARDLKIKGIDFINESKRYYPNGFLAAHIIGFAGVDNEGLEGIELVYDKYLRGSAGKALILRDAKQQELLIEKNFIAPQNGVDIVLTIDETIQFIAERALDKAFEKHHAKSATIIVLDPKTGEVLALANRPTYDLDKARNSTPESRTNRAISFVYEPGSVFKIVTAAAALEEEKFVETDKIFCENGSYKVANHILHDHGSHGTLTFREVIEQSSNIGVTKIAQKIGGDLVYEYGKKFRFGDKTGIELRGEVTGLLKPTSQWSKTSIGAIPIGQEVTVTPLQLAAAIATIANNGVYMKPYVVKYIKDGDDQVIKSFEPHIVDRAISEDTAQRLTDILEGVVESGTAKSAKIEGIKVAGKTGTAQKIVNGIYSHNKFYASFFGFAPADNPQLAVIVVVDEPQGTYFGGTVSAPVFKEVVENSLRYMDMARYTKLIQ